MGDRPVWRRTFDLAERALAPRLEGLVQTAGFAEAVAVGVKLESNLRRRAEHHTRRLWHAVNLPAGSDVSRLRDQVVGLDRQLRMVLVTLAETQKELEDARSVDPPIADRRDGTRPPRARAQRTARP